MNSFNLFLLPHFFIYKGLSHISVVGKVIKALWKIESYSDKELQILDSFCLVSFVPLIQGLLC